MLDDDLLWELGEIDEYATFFGLIEQVADAQTYWEQTFAREEKLNERYNSEIVPALNLYKELEISQLEILFKFSKSRYKKHLTPGEKKWLQIRIERMLYELTKPDKYQDPLFNAIHNYIYGETLIEGMTLTLDDNICRVLSFLMDKDIAFAPLLFGQIETYQELLDNTLSAVREHYKYELSQWDSSYPVAYPGMDTLPLNQGVDVDQIEEEINQWKIVKHHLKDNFEQYQPMVAISKLYRFDKLSAKATAASKALKKKTKEAFIAKDLKSLVWNFLSWLKFHKEDVATLSVPILHKLNEHMGDLLGTIHLHQEELATHPRNFKRRALNKLFYPGNDLDEVMVQLQEDIKESKEILMTLDQEGIALAEAIKNILSD